MAAHRAFLFGFARAASSAAIALAATATLALQRGTQGEIHFIAGGVGSEERARIAAVEQAYNLRMTFASTTGAFLASTHVDIHRGPDPVFSLTVDGPLLLVRLTPGRYVVTANYDGRLERREVTVPATGRADLVLQWAADGANGSR